MSSKSIFLLCLFLAISTLLVISEVAARDLAETKTKTECTKIKYTSCIPNGGNNRYCRYGCCRREYYGRGCRECCHYAGQVTVTVQPKAKPHD